MRTLPLFSSVAQMPIGVVGAGAGAAATGAGAGAAAAGAGTVVVTSEETDGAGAAVATLVAGAGAAVATGAGAVAWNGAGAGAGFAGVLSATSSSSFFSEPKPFRSTLPSEPEMPGAVILMQDSASQWRGASIWTRFPLIWKVTPLPAW